MASVSNQKLASLWFDTDNIQFKGTENAKESEQKMKSVIARMKLLNPPKQDLDPEFTSRSDRDKPRGCVIL